MTKKIINGIVYNTETAEGIAKFGNGLGGSDFRHYIETLYKTKKGAWFLSGEGGPMTKYARPSGNLTCGGDDIIPLTNEEALEWLESHDFVLEIEKHFADKIEEA